MVCPQQTIHLLRCILIAAVLVMYQNVVRFPDLPGGLLAEAAYRSRQCKDPNGGTDSKVRSISMTKRTQLGVCMIVVGICLLAVQIISLTSFIQGGCPLWILS